jgi:hypothetical protein
VLLIQAVAALLLLAGSALIFKALIEVDAPTSRRRVSSSRRPYRLVHPLYRDHDENLPRAA